MRQINSLEASGIIPRLPIYPGSGVSGAIYKPNHFSLSSLPIPRLPLSLAPCSFVRSYSRLAPSCADTRALLLRAQLLALTELLCTVRHRFHPIFDALRHPRHIATPCKPDSSNHHKEKRVPTSNWNVSTLLPSAFVGLLVSHRLSLAS